MSSVFFRRPVRLSNSVPLISFTFDDFPKSALAIGGAILKRYGARGTYYVSLGLMNQNYATGPAFSSNDLKLLMDEGHELGCHTYGHCDAWQTKPSVFEDSILQNKTALAALLPGTLLKTMSYPIDYPRPGSKRRTAKHFACCRGGGQRINAERTDLNFLNAHIIEQSRGDFASIQRVIDQNREARGWLIFATHDIADSHTAYGCSPDLFEKTVKSAVNSGARIMTVANACEAITRKTV